MTFAAFFAQIGRKRGADPRETIVFDAGSGDVKHPHPEEHLGDVLRQLERVALELEVVGRWIFKRPSRRGDEVADHRVDRLAGGDPPPQPLVVAEGPLGTDDVVLRADLEDVKHPVTGKNVEPKFLGGEAPRVADRDRREALAAWITSADNPYFARHVANLAWSHCFGRGIVHEPDDARVSNPPANGPLLDELGRRFAASGWDFRGLIRDIMASDAYQRACEPTPANGGDTTNFSHAGVRRIRSDSGGIFGSDA